MGVTIRDIARRLGVAPSTVSRALRGEGRISAEMRERVRQMACELGYIPNAHARALATRATYTIGVVIHRRHLPMERSFYGVILGAIEAVCGPQGYHVLFASVGSRSLPRCVEENRVDGVIFLGTDIGPEMVLPLQERLPVVLVDNEVPGMECVVSDNVGGARAATLHLVEHGHRRIAFVAETLADPNFRQRYAGYCQALREAGLPMQRPWVVEGGRRPDSDRIAMAKLLGQKSLPTAIVAANDFMATGAVQALIQAGLRVPHDVAVVGFDDGEMATVVQPPLTTAHVARAKMGEMAARRLLELMRNPRQARQICTLPTPLTIRNSCGCGLQ